MADDQRNQELEQRVATLERRLARRQRRAGMESAIVALMHNLFPAEARVHMRAAGREQLLAARSYLDHWIGKLDAEENGRDAPRETIDIS